MHDLSSLYWKLFFTAIINRVMFKVRLLLETLFTFGSSISVVVKTCIGDSNSPFYPSTLFVDHDVFFPHILLLYSLTTIITLFPCHMEFFFTIELFCWRSLDFNESNFGSSTIRGHLLNSWSFFIKDTNVVIIFNSHFSTYIRLCIEQNFYKSFIWIQS